jgi:hypothetical protein
MLMGTGLCGFRYVLITIEGPPAWERMKVIMVRPKRAIAP